MSVTYDNCKLLDMGELSTPRPGYYGTPIPLNAYELARNVMIGMGFKKVESYCVYKGRVPLLVAWLKENGWKSEPRKNNPFLLCHDETAMVFNYACSETAPDDEYISLFRGCP